MLTTQVDSILNIDNDFHPGKEVGSWGGKVA